LGKVAGKSIVGASFSSVAFASDLNTNYDSNCFLGPPLGCFFLATAEAGETSPRGGPVFSSSSPASSFGRCFGAVPPNVVVGPAEAAAPPPPIVVIVTVGP
jgi:hypothetical protein